MFFVMCLVERTAGTMMQRMSDMLTRWLEGAVRRETEADERQDQSDSDERDSSTVAAPADSLSAVEEHVEASLQDVANLRLSPDPVNDAAECVSEVIANDVLCSASREVAENIASSNDGAQCKDVDTAPVLTDRLSSTSDNLAVSTDNDSVVDNRCEHQNTNNQDSESDNLTSTLQSKHESDITSSASTGILDGTDSNELLYRHCCSVATDVMADEHSQCSQVTAAVEETNEACHTVTVEKNPASHS